MVGIPGQHAAVTIDRVLPVTHVSPLHHRRWVAPLPLIALWLFVCASASCAGGYALSRRDTVRVEPPGWYSPTDESDRATLDRWSSAVGPPVIVRRNSTHAIPRPRVILIVSWNIALGLGNVPALIAELRAREPDAPIVLLLQEAFRKGPEVPPSVPRSARFASRLGSDEHVPAREEIEVTADRGGFDLYYVPSMRNGEPSRSDEDRGNAILSSVALSDYDAIELPFERQRRVAVAATISGTSSYDGDQWHLRVVSTHLDNVVGPKRVWFAAAELARLRQVRGLLQYIRSNDSVVLGGDFNTWSGFDERAYREAAQAFPDTRLVDRRPTFGGHLRLDHLFFRLEDGWTSQFRRADSSYGSDHFPLIATIALP
jgi:endonuclease/exonuclease/phosphatase family metal-dependent hydrolase